ncbi:acylphosphatase [Cupriavidus campinensis]
MTSAHETWHLIAHGCVQGVGYRATCADYATALGVEGWVRNRTDGTVEVMARGPREKLEALRAWMEAGPPAAQVSRVAMAPAGDDAGPFKGFTWLPTA